MSVLSGKANDALIHCFKKHFTRVFVYDFLQHKNAYMTSPPQRLENDIPSTGPQPNPNLGPQ
jgi:hypothetical protein